jgi:hypothetical protein
MVVQAYYPNTWEPEARKSQVRGQPGLYSEFKARLSNSEILPQKTQVLKSKL